MLTTELLLRVIYKSSVVELPYLPWILFAGFFFLIEKLDLCFDQLQLLAVCCVHDTVEQSLTT